MTKQEASGYQLLNVLQYGKMSAEYLNVWTKLYTNYFAFLFSITEFNLILTCVIYYLAIELSYALLIHSTFICKLFL